jgi:hypothetical protein
VLLGVTALAGGLLASCSSSSTTASSAAPSGHVLLVGTFNGHAGQYKTIQSAVLAAHPNDWILVAPGDYHENADETQPAAYPGDGNFGAVYIATPDIHLRGMNRSTVIVDGTKPGSSTPCSSDPSVQDFGANDSSGKPQGRNGILVWKADGVTVDNLTACNFLSGSGSSGNQIWWNGGAGSATIGLHGYTGTYLTATSTYYGGEANAGTYGIFSSDSAGPATWDQVYASNMNDSGMYVGACLQACGITINHAWMEDSALGYSGTNSGGSIVIENSQFDNNQDGLDTNTQIAGDPPAPQNGTCPDNGTSPITHTHSCWVFIHNNVHDNNNPNVPKAGTAGDGPLGTGMTVSGGTNDTVMDNTFANNGAWGALFVPYPDSSTPAKGQTCAGTGGTQNAVFGCVYDPKNDALVGNTFTNNGFFGNASNTDFGLITLYPNEPQNCFSRNTAAKGSDPADLATTMPTCGAMTTAATTPGDLLTQVLCDTTFGPCPAGVTYPKSTGVVMAPLPKSLGSMPNPCQGVPTNAWCSNGSPAGSALGVHPHHGGGNALALGALGLASSVPARRRQPRA